MYRIVYPRSLIKDTKTIPDKELMRIKRAIEKLRDFPDISNIRKLQSHPLADFRIRVGKYRVLFDVDNSKKRIIILRIAHRKDVY